jgi:hypothetical protein
MPDAWLLFKFLRSYEYFRCPDCNAELRLRRPELWFRMVILVPVLFGLLLGPVCVPALQPYKGWFLAAFFAILVVFNFTSIYFCPVEMFERE